MKTLAVRPLLHTIGCYVGGSMQSLANALLDAGRLDHLCFRSRYNEIVTSANAVTMTPGETKFFYWTQCDGFQPMDMDPSILASAHMNLVRVIRMSDASLACIISTRDRGPFGRHGYAFFDQPQLAATALKELGWSVGLRIDAHWCSVEGR